MGERIKLGIIYSYNESWIGGTYYYQNLIRSLNMLTEEEKPQLIIVGNSDHDFDTVKPLNYPYVTFHVVNNVVQHTGPRVIKSLLKRILFPASGITTKKQIQPEIDVLFHPSEVASPVTVKKHLYWIPDFQEVHLPHFFSKENLEYRKQTQMALLSKDHHILFSSNDAFGDFKKLYPTAASQCYVVNFAVFHPPFQDVDINRLRQKFGLSEHAYFFSPNQFWKHKNHSIILKALIQVKEQTHQPFQLLLSGKESDYRNPTYFSDLKEFVASNNLEEVVRFLGFIDRKDQLCLMYNSLAVIQPSLFEGWSTVVEDVKAMNQNVIVSNLGVHKEQLGKQAYYFDPNDEKSLARQMIVFLEQKTERPQFNYDGRLREFGKNFMSVVEKVVAG